MINFALRIQNLSDARDKATRELDGSVRTFSREHMAERRAKVAADFQAGLAALNADYQREENSLRTEAAKARHSIRMAKVPLPLPEYARLRRESMEALAPMLSPSELAAAYSDACASEDLGAQLAIELFKPSFDPEAPGTNAALMDIATRRTAQQNSRAAKQGLELQVVESKLQALASEYANALSPLREQNALTQAAAREPAF